MEEIYTFPGMYRGLVLATDAAETVNVGRIKVEVYPMLLGVATAKENGKTGIETAHLPWATPAMPLFTGAGSGYGCLAIPEVGSFVWVFFEGMSIHQPVYFAEAQTKTFGIPTEVGTHYPDRRVKKTKNGIIIEVDDREDQEEVKVTHPSGSYIQIDSSGNINVVGEGNLNIQVAGDADITVFGTTAVTSAGNLSVVAPRIDLN